MPQLKRKDKIVLDERIKWYLKKKKGIESKKNQIELFRIQIILHMIQKHEASYWQGCEKEGSLVHC